MEQPLKTEINKVNKHLLDTYGKIPDGRPRYKVAWSEDCLEHRRAKVNKFDEHGNFLAEIEGIEQRKKWNWIDNRYLFLKWFPGPAEQDDIMNWDGYECLFAFDNSGEFLVPTIVACEFIIHTMDAIKPTTPEQEKAEQAKKDDEEYKINYAELEDSGKRFEGETVGYSGKVFGE